MRSKKASIVGHISKQTNKQRKIRKVFNRSFQKYIEGGVVLYPILLISLAANADTFGIDHAAQDNNVSRYILYHSINGNKGLILLLPQRETFTINT